MEPQDVLKVIRENFTGKAISTKGSCQYLTNEGRKCAIGIFIPDGHKAQHSEVGISKLLRDNPDLESYMPTRDKSLLSRWQIFHDEEIEGTEPLRDQQDALFNEYQKITKSLK